MQKKAIILFSGGLDSTTCLVMAKAQGFVPYALSFHYNQKHQAEISATSSSVLRIIAAFVIGAASGFSAAHYILWYLSDLIPAILGCGLLVNVLSVATFVAAVVFGGIAAWDKHGEIVNNSNMDPASMNCTPAGREKLQKEYDELKKKIEVHKAAPRGEKNYIYYLASLARIIGKALETPFYKAYDYFMSAAFIARVFTLPCTSVFIPKFFHMAAAVAVLSSTTTLLIIFGVGVAWAVFRTIIRKVEDQAALESNCAAARVELAILEGKQQNQTRESVYKKSVDNNSSGRLGNPSEPPSAPLRFFTLSKTPPSSPQKTNTCCDRFKSVMSGCSVQ